MQNLKKEPRKLPIIYVTRDIERASGLGLDTPGYFIISNYTPFGNSVAKGRKNVLLIKEKKQLNTWELLSAQKRDSSVASLLRNGQLLVFKPTPQIEKICAENNWKLLNPPAELSNKIEEKISQIEWLGELKKYLPPYQIKKCRNIMWSGKPFIIQFNRSHTGSGTILVNTKKILGDIKKIYPEREARIAPYIKGPLFTNNNVVSKNKILIGNISYQITGLMPFTDKQFATIGNDWALPRKILSKKQLAQYKKIATDIGLRLKKTGWKGLFGIDVVVDEKTGRLYLLEINARQPASTAYESQLQSLVIPSRAEESLSSAQKDVSNNPTYKSKEKGSLGSLRSLGMTNQLTTFEAHLAALSDTDLSNHNLIPITDGAQIVQRVTEQIPSLPEPRFYRRPSFNAIKYENDKMGSDLLRIQTSTGIMAKHEKLNKLGWTMIDFISCVKGNNAWDSPRGGVIITKNKKLLVIERNKFGRHYLIFPGGTWEKGDGKIADTAVREAFEETNLRVKLDTAKKPIRVISSGRDETYFFVKNFTGKPKLSGPEKNYNSKENSYKLRWIELGKLKQINLLPPEIKEKVIVSANGYPLCLPLRRGRTRLPPTKGGTRGVFANIR
ncbi:MAG: NUDIX domain-containing protein [Candidatus Magasanikbacteria bacterium]|nr:NUDIX domain-containing protein [Candidatus Magasanikbacteria bacterium]